ncbi:hypothetical protein F2Q70_00007678 [Brassica cretica]|uniref:Uncharacterized protein n=1 Tax=Brassica cretica TaxID=69181 RepID=A0A8S9M630_BRACR|nr:hypothetical protein F2Q70_00007678 [Brassica cretica]
MVLSPQALKQLRMKLSNVLLVLRHRNEEVLREPVKLPRISLSFRTCGQLRRNTWPPRKN